MFRKLGKVKNNHLIVEIALILALLIVVLSSSVPTQAAQPAAPLSAPAWYTCVSVHDVSVYNSRVHIKCNSTIPVITNVYYFAVPSSDSANASRYLSLFETALLSGKPLMLFVDAADTSGNTWGCSAGDCRVIVGAQVGP